MAQTVRYINGVETGDTSELASGGADFTAVTSPVRSGNYALKCLANAQNAADMIAAGGIAAATFAARFGLRISALPSVGPWVFYDSSGTGLTVYIDTAGQINISDGGAVLGFTLQTGATVLSANTWYLIDLTADSGAGGSIKLWINGVAELNFTHSANPGNFDRWRIIADGAAGADTFFDDVRLDSGGTAKIGNAKGILRQGVAGTPTYDAGTKNGAATAALCWSETPFSAAKNVTVVGVTPQAQTMLIEKFSITQTGHGTETIASGDTINACKTMFIAKTALASNGAIRRRIGGVDTDTIVALTTSDKYFDDGIWTTTPANLDTAEAGTVSQTANIDTIEDVWIYVDYTPGVASPFIPITFPLPPRAIAAPQTTYLFNRTLIGQDKLPTRQMDWPLPRTVPLHLDRSRQQPFDLLNLTGKDRLPNRQMDWRVAPMLPSQPDKSRQQSFDLLNLTGKDLLPFRQSDWRLPKAAPWGPFEWDLNLLTTTLSITIVQAPFNQFVWPLPVAALLAPRRVNNNQFATGLLGQDQLPVRQTEWRLPIVARQAPQAHPVWLPSFFPVTALLPFNQYDWRLPVVAVPPIWVRPHPFNVNLLGKDALPFRQMDWRLPVVARQTPQPQFQSLPSFFPVIALLPFNQADWRLPRTWPRLYPAMNSSGTAQFNLIRPMRARAKVTFVP